MTLRTKIGMLLTVACLAALPGMGRASTALPKGIGVGDYQGGGGRCVDGFTSNYVGAGYALIQNKLFGPVFHAALTIELGCTSQPASGPARYTFEWSGVSRLLCSGSGSYTGFGAGFSGPVTCHQLPSGLTYSGRMKATVAPVVGPGRLALTYRATVTLS